MLRRAGYQVDGASRRSWKDLIDNSGQTVLLRVGRKSIWDLIVKAGWLSS